VLGENAQQNDMLNFPHLLAIGCGPWWRQGYAQQRRRRRNGERR